MAYKRISPIVIAEGGTNAKTFTQSNGIVTYNGTSLVNYAGPQIDSSGRSINTTQPVFLAYLGSSDSNKTGNGASFTLGSGNALTKVYDVGTNFNTNGTFTAPVTGKYIFYASALLTNGIAADESVWAVTATSRTLDARASSPNSGQNIGVTISVIIDMTAADTCHMVITTFGEVSDRIGINGQASTTYFGGMLVC